VLVVRNGMKTLRQERRNLQTSVRADTAC